MTEARTQSTLPPPGRFRSRGPKGRRLWVYRLAAVTVFPLVLVLILEAVLRLSGYGYDPAFAIEGESGDGAPTPYYRDNPSFGWRFFPRSIARTATHFRIPVDKEEKAVRVFILGGSAAQGDPDGSYSFSRILEVLLEARYPSVKFEVVNTGAVAINSHVVLEIAEDVCRLSPDLFVVYMGNNEVVGPFGPGSVFTPASSYRMIQWSKAIRASRLGQLILEAVSRRNHADGEPDVWKGMAFFLENRIRATDPRLENVYRHFARNLDGILDAAEDGGAKAIVCTVGVNLRDSPPFASLHREDFSPEDQQLWEELVDNGKGKMATGDCESALESFRKALELDDQYAELHFLVAQCLLSLEEDEEARRHLGLARDLDALRFRADSTINSTIEETVRTKSESNVRLADIERLFSEAGLGAIPGASLFHDHVHMNYHGNYLIAREIASHAGEMLDGLPPPQAVLTEEEAASRLAYTLFDRMRIEHDMIERMEKPPFTNQWGHADRIAGMKESLEERKASLDEDFVNKTILEYERALAHDPEDWLLHFNFSKVWMQLQEWEKAEGEVRKALEIIPWDQLAMSRLGDILVRMREYEEALAWLNRVATERPREPEIRWLQAVCYAHLGDSAKAMDALKAARESGRDRVTDTVELSKVFLEDGDPQAALELAGIAVEQDRDHPDAHYAKGLALVGLGQAEDALAAFEEALKEDPGWPLPMLEMARIRSQDPREDLRNGELAVGLAGPANAALEFRNARGMEILAGAFAEAGRFEDALQAAALSKALYDQLGDAEGAERVTAHVTRLRNQEPLRYRLP